MRSSSAPACRRVLGVAGAALSDVVLFVDVDGWAARFEQSFEPEPAALQPPDDLAGVDADHRATSGWPAPAPARISDAMIVYQQTRVWVGSMQRWAHFNNAHSHYVQVAARRRAAARVPVALRARARCALLGRRAVRADKGEMFWVRVGAAAGLAGLAAQSIWEVALIMPANAVLAGVLGGLLLYRREARPEADAVAPELMTPAARRGWP